MEETDLQPPAPGAIPTQPLPPIPEPTAAERRQLRRSEQRPPVAWVVLLVLSIEASAVGAFALTAAGEPSVVLAAVNVLLVTVGILATVVAILSVLPHIR